MATQTNKTARNLFLFLPAQECGTLKNPRYGQVVLTGTIFGSTATYSCNTGFILVGEQTRTCQANGKWSGRAATCHRKYETSTYTIITMVLYFLARFFSSFSCELRLSGRSSVWSGGSYWDKCWSNCNLQL